MNRVIFYLLCVDDNMFALFFYSPILLFIPISEGEPLFSYFLVRCQFFSSDGHDMMLVGQYYFNKVLVLEYNSTVGKFIAFTPYAQEYATLLNNVPHFLREERKQLDVCKSRIPLMLDMFSHTAEPNVKLRSVEEGSSKHPSMLVCSMYDFYPKTIRVTWLRNGKEVTSDVTSTLELSDDNWLYQLHSYLEYTPIYGEEITCMVEHASLMEPKFYEWDPMSESERNKIAVGTAGLLLGVIFSAIGAIYFKKNSSGRVLVPAT